MNRWLLFFSFKCRCSPTTLQDMSVKQIKFRVENKCFNVINVDGQKNVKVRCTNRWAFLQFKKEVSQRDLQESKKLSIPQIPGNCIYQFTKQILIKTQINSLQRYTNKEMTSKMQKTPLARQ